MKRYFIFVFALLGFLLPLQASAITISSLEVDITAGRTFAIWANTSINPGQQAIFTQNNGFNFDSSDPTNCVPGCVPQVKVTLGGSAQTFNDSTAILAAHGTEQGAVQLINEFANWVQIGSVNIGSEHIDVFVAYADNAHPNTNPAGIPNPWSGSPGVTVFDGAPSSFAGGVCNPNCFDAGAVRFVDTARTIVPEPATLLLLGAGLISLGLVGWRRREN